MHLDPRSLRELLLGAQGMVTIVGLSPFLETWQDVLSSIETAASDRPEMTLLVLYESEDHLFLRSLTTDSRFSKPRISYKVLQERRARALRALRASQVLRGRLRLLQLNLPLTTYVVAIDDGIWYAPVLDQLHGLSLFRRLSLSSDLRQAIRSYIDFITSDEKGGIFQSSPDSEMLVMYDRQDIPRGLFPRKAFYNTDFQRSVVWLLVFNRRGQLLLHKRSSNAADNWNLWDKSAGGHVDPDDRSTTQTAHRELVEELILPKGEHQKYVQERNKDFVDLGVWDPAKRVSELPLMELRNLSQSDWCHFHLPSSISYTSKRRVREKTETGEWSAPMVKETKFLIDIFLFVTPAGLFETDEDLRQLSKDVSLEHKLIAASDLLSWIEEQKLNGDASNVFTDDLLFILDAYREVIEGFAENILAAGLQ